MCPVGGVLPNAPAVGRTGRVPCGATVNVGKGEGVRKDAVGEMEPGVAVERAVIPIGVFVGRGRGGFRNVYTKALPSRQSPMIPQPNPPNRNLSKVLKNF